MSLTKDLVQYGIDLYGCVKAGYGWPAFGGHRSGRKLPILMAGLLLGDDAMKNVSASLPQPVRRGHADGATQQHPGRLHAQAWQGATVIYGGHYGVDVLTAIPRARTGSTALTSSGSRRSGRLHERRRAAR